MPLIWPPQSGFINKPWNVFNLNCQDRIVRNKMNLNSKKKKRRESLLIDNNIM